MEMTKEVRKALEHVQSIYPQVHQVFFSDDGRWRFCGEIDEAPEFDDRVDVGLLEAALDSLDALPAAFSIPTVEEQQEPEQLQKFNVNIYPVVRVKVCGIEAKDHEEAMKKAETLAWPMLCDMFPAWTKGEKNEYPEDFDEPQVFNCGFSEDITGYLVDEANDPEYVNSVQYDTDPSRKRVDAALAHARNYLAAEGIEPDQGKQLCEVKTLVEILEGKEEK
jgi:hypothetical protein